MYRIIGADGREYGPVSLAQLRHWLVEGRVNAQTSVLAEGATEWRTLAQIPEFALAHPAAFAPRVHPLAPRPLQTNGFAVTGLILAIFSLMVSCCCCGGLPLNLLALVVSAIGWSQISRQPDVYTGKGTAIAGVILSCLGLLVGMGVLVFSLILNWDDFAREINNL